MKQLISTLGQADLARKLVSEIKKNNSKKSLMVNISGATGSGKSTWAKHIAKDFEKIGQKVLHVSEDDFLEPRQIRNGLKNKIYESGEWKGESYWKNHDNWLRLGLMREVIENLKMGKGAKYYPYLRTTGEISQEEKSVEPADVIIFETSIYNELFEVVVLIDVEDEILLERKLKRDSDLRDEETIREYHEVQLKFWDKHKPSNPNFIIDNNDYQNPKPYKFV